MVSIDRWGRSAALSVAFAMTAAITGCAGSVEYRTYDPYYHDYHVWGAAEAPFYNQWTVETGHPHVEYNHLRKTDREAYWRWRHDHR